MSESDQAAIPLKVDIHQEKATLFRVIHADGAWISSDPYRNLHVTFYNERAPIPRSIQLSFSDAEGWRENVDARTGKQGWFREMEVDVVLSIEAVRSLSKSLAKWLPFLEGEQQELEKAQGKA